jgi:rhodanese-related sulfurtransferase
VSRPAAARRAAAAALALALGAAAPPPGAAQAPAPVRASAAAWRTVTPLELRALLADRRGVVLVNVHVPFEGDIPGTDLHVPYDRVATSRELPQDRAAPIVLYCRSGSMSTEAARTLVGLGYTNVTELRGGFNAWIAAGLPFSRQKAGGR